MLQARLDALTALSHSPLLDNDAHLPDFYRAAQNIKRIYGDDLLLVDRQGRVLMHTARPLGTPLSPVSWPKGRAAAPMVFATGRPAVGDAFIGPLLIPRWWSSRCPWAPKAGPSARWPCC